jgi:hypothetical protein
VAFDPGREEPLEPLADGAVEALVSFLPTFEDPTFIPSIERGGKDDGSGVIEWPWFDYAPEVREFEQLLYPDGWIVAFDWGAWQDEGRALARGDGIESADLDDLRRLLTVIFRKERFNEGTVAVAFWDGTLLRILPRALALGGTSRQASTHRP